ncbi:MAG: DKNYY domain-containing protein [Leptospirales bacterium]
MKAQFYKYSVLFITIFIVGSCQEGYEKSFLTGKVTFNNEETSVRDKKSFKIINRDYAIDKARVYYRGYEIENSDGKTFVLLKRGYSKDKNQVYFCFNHLDGSRYYTKRVSEVYILEGEDPEQFVILDQYFAKGNLHAYFNYTKLMNSHGPSFETLGNSYGKDRENVYHNFNIMLAHAPTFHLLNSSFAVDKDSAYYDGHALYDSDISSFEILFYNISKDKNNVYSGYEKVDGIDAESYTFFPESNYAKDKYHVYLGTKIIPEADVKTFIAKKGSYYAKDKNNYYNYGSVIQKDDPAYEDAVEEYGNL